MCKLTALSKDSCLLSVDRERLSPVFNKKRILNIAFWLTSHKADCNGKVFSAAMWAQHFLSFLYQPPFPSHILTSEVSFICTFLPCQGWVSRSRGRKRVSPTECCVLSKPRAESIASHPPSPPSSFTPPPLMGLWSVQLCCLFGGCGCEGNTEQHAGPCRLPPQHRNILIKHQTTSPPTLNPKGN